jgi:hypothetical protein
MTQKQVFKHLILIALLCRALVPAGWMPSVSADTLITICSVSGQKAFHPDAPMKNAPSEECAFATSAHAGFVPDAPVHAAEAKTDTLRAAVIAARFSPGSPRAPPLNA